MVYQIIFMVYQSKPKRVQFMIKESISWLVDRKSLLYKNHSNIYFEVKFLKKLIHVTGTFQNHR